MSDCKFKVGDRIMLKNDGNYTGVDLSKPATVADLQDNGYQLSYVRKAGGMSRNHFFTKDELKDAELFIEESADEKPEVAIRLDNPFPYKRILKYFKYDHLPEHLQAVSKGFHVLAWEIADRDSEVEETMAGLRKLLEAKDCAVRAMVK